jgi:hypothetical protein
VELVAATSALPAALFRRASFRNCVVSASPSRLQHPLGEYLHRVVNICFEPASSLPGRSPGWALSGRPPGITNWTVSTRASVESASGGFHHRTPRTRWLRPYNSDPNSKSPTMGIPTVRQRGSRRCDHKHHGSEEKRLSVRTRRSHHAASGRDARRLVVMHDDRAIHGVETNMGRP